MSRSPQPGQDNDQWGAILNDYLTQSLLPDGRLKAAALAAVLAGTDEVDVVVDPITNRVTISVDAITQVDLEDFVQSGYISNDSLGASVAPLENGKIPVQFIPAVPTNNTFVVNSQAAMLALAAAKGDRAVRTDVGAPYSEYVLQALPATALANWTGIPQTVTSVQGRVGAVTLNDVLAPYDPTSAVDGLFAYWDAAAGKLKFASPVGSAGLGTFTLTGQAALGYITAPGFVASRAVSLDQIELRLFMPPLGGAMNVRIWKVASAATTSLGTISVAAGKRRAVLSGLGTTLAVGDEVRAEITAVGTTYPGGEDLLMTMASAGVAFPALGAAPAGVTGLTATSGAGSVRLTWNSAAGATEYLITRNGTPIGFVTAMDYTDSGLSSGQTYAYNVYAATRDAVSSPASASAGVLDGAFYNGSALIPSGTAAWGSTADVHWLGSYASGGGVVGSNAASIWTTDPTNTPHKIMRTSGGDGVAASLLATKTTLRLRWESAGGNVQVKTRRNGVTDSQGLTWVVAFGSTSVQYRHPGAGSSTTASASGSGFTAASNTDFLVEVIDDPNNNVYEMRVWKASDSRPASATLSSSDANLYASGSGWTMPAGNIGMNITYNGSAKVVDVLSLQIQTV